MAQLIRGTIGGMPVESPRELARPTSRTDQYCAACGYDLRGISITCCPECGVPFEQDGQVLAAIPWLQRRAIGRVDAFRMTVRLVLSRPSVLVEQMHADVELSDDDAGRFRWVCILIAAFSVGLTAMLFADVGRPGELSWKLLLTELASPWPAALLFFYLAGFPIDRTGKFASFNEERRFRRLYEFTSAPLALFWAVPILGRLLLLVLKNIDPQRVIWTLVAVELIAWQAYATVYQVRAAGRDAVWIIGNLLTILCFWSILGLACYVCWAMTFARLNVWIGS